MLPGRYQTVAVFLKMLPEVNSFGATAEGAPVLAAMRALPGVLAYRGKLPAPLNDRGMGRGAKIVSGAVRDSLHMVDVFGDGISPSGTGADPDDRDRD